MCVCMKKWQLRGIFLVNLQVKNSGQVGKLTRNLTTQWIVIEVAADVSYVKLNKKDESLDFIASES